MNATLHSQHAADTLAAIRSWALPAPRITALEREERLVRARRIMAAMDADALLVVAGASLRYFAGIPWAMSERLVALLLPLQGQPLLIAPEFERGSLQAVTRIKAELHCWEEHEDPIALVTGLCKRHRIGRLALDPQTPWFAASALHSRRDAVSLSNGAAIIDRCRMQKSSTELALIQQAMSMTLEVHRLAASILEPGIGTGAVRRFIDDAHRAMGADNGSTFCAVQFGEATAYPHGLPGEQRLGADDLVLIDTGCQVDGYNSDVTRTYAFGKPNPKHEAVWNQEREAQQAAFDAVRPGVACEEIDAAARRVLERAGYGPEYRLPGLPHRTGHGLGLSIHEPAYLVRGDKTPLAEGMCFSNEPMIVLPGEFGIRLEDHFHVTSAGARWFTPPSTSIVRAF